MILDQIMNILIVPYLKELLFGLIFVIIECPPALFSAMSGREMGVSFGGSPTVCLRNSPGNINKFRVHTLDSWKQVCMVNTL